jgi:hypothetical protein
MTIRKNVSFHHHKRRSKPIRFDLPPERGSSAERGYDHKWRLFARDYRRNHPLCLNYAKCRNGTEQVDHKIPLILGGEKYDDDNLSPLCSSCHSRKTQKDKVVILKAIELGYIQPNESGWYDVIDRVAAISLYLGG